MDVVDDGVGIESRHVVPFVRSRSSTTKPVGQGTGLGLSTVYGIVKAAEGRVDVRSTEGPGTTMSVYWPRAEPKVPTPTGERPTTAPSASVRTPILVVEDDAAIRALLVTRARAERIHRRDRLRRCGRHRDAANRGAPRSSADENLVMEGVGGAEVRRERHDVSRRR
jgi:hypothetical protein